MRLITISTFLLLSVLSTLAATTRVLAIGNSFSQDAVEQNLYELAIAGGDTLIIGNAYIPGCQIDLHVENFETDRPAYSYRKVVDGVKTTTPEMPLSKIINDEQWDIITIQQASHFSGLKAKYARLPELIAFVREKMPVKGTPIAWHATWSYARDARHDGFKNYGNSQKAMSDSIATIVATVIPQNGIDLVIPAGVAIDNARRIFGDVMNSDGYHLSELGRYTAACTWHEFLTGMSVKGNPYHPSTISPLQARSAQKAAHDAVSSLKKPCFKALK